MAVVAIVTATACQVLSAVYAITVPLAMTNSITTGAVTGAVVAMCFSPEEDCSALAVDAIDRAEQQILVSAYGLTTISKAVEALRQAKRRGVDIRVIADRCQFIRTIAIEFVEQCFRLFEIGHSEALGEPAVDKREEVAGFGGASWSRRRFKASLFEIMSWRCGASAIGQVGLPGSLAERCRSGRTGRSRNSTVPVPLRTVLSRNALSRNDLRLRVWDFIPAHRHMLGRLGPKLDPRLMA
jgi:hypothetical protein